jgi:hypothetical protein
MMSGLLFNPMSGCIVVGVKGQGNGLTGPVDLLCSID